LLLVHVSILDSDFATMLLVAVVLLVLQQQQVAKRCSVLLLLCILGCMSASVRGLLALPLLYHSVTGCQ
jgi:hypothetical protein